MLRVIKDIKDKTRDMDAGARFAYIRTYYWYHILGICLLSFLLIFLILHFAFPEEKPLFRCALVNQEIDQDRDEALEDQFAENSGLSRKQIQFDSDYVISYDGSKKEGTNESSFDKFFFQWSGGELDAVVMDKDFLQYCIEVGGEFYPAADFDTGSLTLCQVDGVSVIDLGDTALKESLIGEDLVVAFPATGKHMEACQEFVDYLKEKQ